MKVILLFWLPCRLSGKWAGISPQMKDVLSLVFEKVYIKYMFLITFICVCACMHYGVPAEVRRQLARGQFLHSTMWSWELNSGLEA